MDQFVKLRGSYRGSFTTFTKKVQEFLLTNVDDKVSCAGFLAQLQEKYSKIETIDKQIIPILLEDENCSQSMLDEEIETAENYNGTFIDLKTKLELHINVSNELNETQREIDSNSTRSSYKLPKIEFQKFDGNLKNYLSFWGLFGKIHEDPSISEIDKFQYLIQSTLKGSRAREVVESFPVTAENYQQAIECLNSRFGREDVLIEVYVRELLSLVLSNALGQEHMLPIVKLYDRIETQLRFLKILGVTSDKYASMLYPLVESSLPIDLLRIWERHLNSISVRSEEKGFNKLEMLMQFLRSEIEGEEKNILATSGFGIENKMKRNFQNKGRFSPVQNKIAPTGIELLTSSQEKTFKYQQCIFCDKPHSNTECRKAENMNYEQKRQILMKRGACFKCLKLNHISATCRAKGNCTICGKSHHFLLCRNNQKSHTPSKHNIKNDEVISEQKLANVTSSPCVLLQTLAVILRGERKCLKIRAIIDSASQRSYILKSTAEKVGYQPTKQERLKHSLFGGSSTKVCKHDVFKAHVSSIDDAYRCNFDVLSQLSICESIPAVTQELCRDELSSLGINFYDRLGPIQLLIGADVAGKLMTGKLRRLNSCLTAIETKLGWTVLGRTKEFSEQTENFMVISMLNRDVRINDLWELDCLGIKNPAEKQSKEELEETTKEHFENTLKKDISGRYIESLPWIINHQILPDNKSITERKLKSTEETLQNKDLIEDWNHVPRSLNPADSPSRGCNVDVLVKTRWWEGPQFLKSPVDEWPRKKIAPDMEIVNSEEKKSIISALSAEKPERFYEKYSSYLKILRIVAWLYRFVSKLKKQSCKTSKELNAEEIKHAELILLELVQAEEFSKGINDRLRNLHPIVDKNAVLRVKTLVFRRKGREDFRSPIILPEDHYIAQKLIKGKQRELIHAAVQILLNNLREKYWILRRRKSIRQVTMRCATCRRFTVNALRLESPPLPKVRTLPQNCLRNHEFPKGVG